MDFTIEAILAPVVNDDWSVIHDALDVVPGSVLISDPEAPVLVVTAQVHDIEAAERFLHGLIEITGIQVSTFSIFLDSEDVDVAEDFLDSDEVAETPMVVKALNLYAHA